MSLSNSKMLRSRSLSLVALITGLIILSTITPAMIAPAAADSPSNLHVDAPSPIQKFTLSEWTVPTSAAKPYGVGTDTNGRVWFTENATNKFGRFDPTNNNFTEWNFTTANSQPHNVFVKLVTTPNASVTQVFFTEYASNKIARFDTSTNNLTEWTLPSGSNPMGIYVDDNNDVWFTESGRDIIARLTPSNSHLTEWTLPGATATPGTPALKPWGIYVQLVTRPSYSNRFVWFTENIGNKIGRLEVTSNTLTLWDLGTLVGFGLYQPTDMVMGVFQTLPVAIFTNMNNIISVLGNDTGGGSLYQQTVLPSIASGPMGITYDSPRNAAWFAEYNAANIANLNTTLALAGQLFTPTYCTIPPQSGSSSCTAPSTTTTSNATRTMNRVTGVSGIQNPTSTTVNIHQGPINGVTEYSLPVNTSRPFHVAVDTQGNVWFTENNVTANRIGRLSIQYLFQISATPNLQTINPGQSTTFALNVTLSSGYPQSLQLSLINTPTGVTAIFNPQSKNPPFTSTLTFTTTNSTPTGTFPMTVQATSGGQVQSVLITLKIQAVLPPSFDFSVSVAGPSTASVTQGGSASFGLTVTLLSGSPQIVNLTASGFPSGVSYSFTNPGGTPSFTSTINVFTTVNTPGGTYPITITGTGAGLTHTATPTPVLTITELPRDFNLSSPTTQLVLVQSSRTATTITLQSIGYFNGNVTLGGTFSPSSGLTVAFTPPAVFLQPNGGIAQDSVVITAPKNTVGTYTLTVTATSSTPSRTHQLTITVRVSPCLIATATYGSELAPQVQFLRNFRDQQIMDTFAGSNFMTAFNAWYYSFSPSVAGYESTSPSSRALARTVLYPLIGILRIASSTFKLFGPVPEFAALVTGLLAGSLIGLAYLALPAFCTLWLLRRRLITETKSRVRRVMALGFATLLAAFLVSEVFALAVPMMVSSTGLVLGALAAGSLLPALEIIEYAQRRA